MKGKKTRLLDRLNLESVAVYLCDRTEVVVSRQKVSPDELQYCRDVLALVPSLTLAAIDEVRGVAVRELHAPSRLRGYGLSSSGKRECCRVIEARCATLRQ